MKLRYVWRGRKVDEPGSREIYVRKFVVLIKEKKKKHEKLRHINVKKFIL